MREPEDAAAVLGQLHRHALAHAAEAVEGVMREDVEIPDQRVAAIGGGALRHGRFSLYRKLPELLAESALSSPSIGLPVSSETARTAARATRHTATFGLSARTATEPEARAFESVNLTCQTGPTCSAATTSMTRPGTLIRANPLRLFESSMR